MRSKKIPGSSAERPKDAPDPFGDAAQLRRLLQDVVRGFGLLSAHETPCGQPVSPSNAHALMVLLERKRLAQPTSQTDLGASLGIDKSNVTRLCGRMEAAGHVLQRRSTEDLRSRRVELTPEGSALAARIEAASHARFAALITAVPAAKRRPLLDCLAELNVAVQALRPTKEDSP